VKAFVITAEMGQNATHRQWVHGVHISPDERLAKARAENECRRLNDAAAGERLMLARRERQRIQEIIKKPDPRSEAQLAEQFRSFAPHYVVTEIEAVLTTRELLPLTA
jgi:hypothetical protein